MTATTEHSSPIDTKAISSPTTTHPLSDLHDGAASGRRQLCPFPRPGHGVRVHGRDGTCRSQETKDIGISSRFSDDSAHVAVDFVNRNNVLDFGRTTCRRIRPEPQPERTGLLVGTW